MEIINVLPCGVYSPSDNLTSPQSFALLPTSLSLEQLYALDHEGIVRSFRAENQWLDSPFL
jgi:hypothetical protein